MNELLTHPSQVLNVCVKAGVMDVSEVAQGGFGDVLGVGWNGNGKSYEKRSTITSK